MIKKNGSGILQFDGIALANTIIKGLGFLVAITMFFFTVIQPQLSKVAVNENRIQNIEKELERHERDINRLERAEARRSNSDEETINP